MSNEELENILDLEIKEQLYMLFLEIKEELTKKNIEIDKEELEEISKTTKLETIINYIREMVYILINTKFPKKNDEINLNENINKDSETAQFQSQIRKLEYDIRYLIQKEFQDKIKRDSLEMKINAYMEMESEFEELKEKVKYEGGKFLNNERKDNEIIILRQENCILKKEIEKYEINNKKYESKLKSEKEKIEDLNNQIASLNKKISELELINSKKESGNQQNNNNSSINININNNGNASSKWIIKQENQDITNINNSNNNSNSFSNLNFKKRKVNNFTKNNKKYSPSGSGSSNGNLNIRTRYTRYEPERVESGFKTKNHKINGINTMNNNNAFTATYSKILNNIFVKFNKSPSKRQTKSKNKNKKKNSSISMYLEEYDKSSMENKYITNKVKKYNSNRKNINGYSRIIGLVPNSKLPLSGKNHKGKKNYIHSLPKKYLNKDKNHASYSALIINRK
jgi:hypothetical protein